MLTNLAEPASDDASARTHSRRWIVAAALLVLLAGVVVAKALGGAGSAPTPKVLISGAGGAGGSITSVRNDAVADYEAALTRGRPVFVLFHSLSCKSCVELSGIVDRVIPEYDDQITFVNAITADSSGAELAKRFSFGYIPTSFFLEADGTVVDAFTGAMSEDDLRDRLDQLAQPQ